MGTKPAVTRSNIDLDKKYFYTSHAYDKAKGYQCPSVEELKADTRHPHTNNLDYHFFCKLKYEPPKDFLPVFSLIECSDGYFVIGTNDFISPIFDGNFIGTRNFDVIANKQKERTEFLAQQKTTVTGMKFLDTSVLLAATKNCTMKLYSIHKENDNESVLLKYEELSTEGFVKAIDSIKNQKFVYGTSHGDIHVENVDLMSLTRQVFYSRAHKADISGISGCPHSTDKFASCSLDNDCLLWDVRKSKPASGLLTKFENQLTAVKWTKQKENHELILLGDCVGNIITVDPRRPNRIISRTRVSNRPISSINFNGTKRFGVVSQSNAVSIMKIEPDGELKEIFKHKTAGLIHSMCWDSHDEKIFYVVGEHKYAEKIVLPF